MSVVTGYVELPPEANPLTAPNLLQTLQNAASSRQTFIQTAAQQLSNWESEPGFYSGLQTILADRSQPFEIRSLAAIQIKNGIDKYWRKTARHAIGKDEKQIIKERSLELGVAEPDSRLALQNAIAVAKIVRHEFPHDWPEAIPRLIETLRTLPKTEPESLILLRTLLLLLYIVKELSTARLQRSRSSVYKIAPELLEVVGEIYLSSVTRWIALLHEGRGAGATTVSEMDRSLLALRILRRLIVTGYEHPNRHQEVQQLWGLTRMHFGELPGLISGANLDSTLRTRVEAHLLQISKMHLNVVKVHPNAFPQLGDALAIAQAYWNLLVEYGKAEAMTVDGPAKIGTDGDAEDDISCMEKLSLKGLLILRACVKMVYNPAQTFKYQRAEDKEERNISTEAIRNSLLSNKMTRDMMELLVTRFFIFRPRDLRMWETEPTEWERQEEGEGENWEFSIRICAEKLFLDLIINNKDNLIPPLLQVFYTVAAPGNEDVMLKDAIYAAVGLAAPVLERRLDFNAFVKATLMPETQLQRQAWNIVRRRIAIFIGQWVLVSDLARAPIYQIFQHLLDPSDPTNDIVVRVTAGRQLKNVIEPWDMQIDAFNPFSKVIVERLLALVQEVDLAETKMALLGTLSTIVVRMEQHIDPLADGIVATLPLLWEQAEDEYLLKQAILGLLSVLMGSLREGSVRFHEVILPLIESAVRPESEVRPYLLDDTLDLWSAVLSQTENASPEILSMVHLLFPILESGSENIRVVFGILEQYFLLAPVALIEGSARIADSLTTMLQGNLRREVLSMVLHLTELMVRIAFRIDGATLIRTLTSSLLDAGLLQELLKGLQEAYDAHQTTGPNRTRTSVDGTVETAYFAILARILYASPSTFVDAIRASALVFETTMPWLLTEWFSHLDDIGNTDSRKLMTISMTKLLELGPHKVLIGRLQEYMHAWTACLLECMEEPIHGPAVRDCLVYNSIDELRLEGIIDSPEDARRRELTFCDPVHRINIKDYIRQHLQNLIAVTGGQEAFHQQWLVNVDQDVVKSFADAQGL